MPILQGGAGSHTLSNHVIGKRTVNMTLATGHQSRPGARLKFPIATWPAVHQIHTKQYHYFDWGRRL
jgi:hypothetical protein